MNALRIGAVSLTVLVFAACSPIGGIGVSAVVETFWVVPKRLEYAPSVPFSRKHDLEVRGIIDGAEVSIPIEEVEIGVVDNPSFPDNITWVSDAAWNDTGDLYPLGPTPGERIIVVNYNSGIERYTIRVNSDGSSPEGGGLTIDIIWG